MSRVEQLESTSQANFKDKDAPQALGSWKEYEALRFPFPMHQAALFNDCDVVAEYLHCKRGCYRIDINASDSCGRTIAHICAMEGHLVLLLFIIDRRPNLEIKDCDVRSAFLFVAGVFVADALLQQLFIDSLSCRAGLRYIGRPNYQSLEHCSMQAAT
jgi:hypothetical protein